MRSRVAYLRGLIADLATKRREQVVRELENVGFANPTDVMKWGPDGVEVHESETLTPDQAAGVKSVKAVIKRAKGKDGTEVETTEVQVVQHDKVGALKDLAKIHGLHPERGGPTAAVNVVLIAPPKLSEEEWMAQYGNRE